MATNSENIQNDETRFEESKEQKETVTVIENEPAKTSHVKNDAKNGVEGVIGAAAVAGGAMLFTSFKEPHAQQEQHVQHAPQVTVVNHDSEIQPAAEPVHFNGEEVPVAHSVNDDMSLNEAFAAARHEVGPGGVFEWQGHVYGTYHTNEWQGLSPEYQHAFSSYHYNIEPEPHIVDDQPHVVDEPRVIETQDDIHVLPSDEGDVSILNSEHIDAGSHDVAVVSTVVDGHGAALVNTDLDGDYDISVVNDNGDHANPSAHEIDSDIPIDHIHELHDNSLLDDSAIHVHDNMANDNADFNNNADVSNFVQS